jgi:FAD/FMN-containing dehydrogenase
LQKISFNAAKTEAVLGGGVVIQDLVEAAYGNGTRFANPTCICLGFLGSVLGGGLNRAAGLYGWGVDQILSANVVLASGETVTASKSSNVDLFWALKGAAPNFGIVTSATVQAYPVSCAQNIAWQGPLAFADDQLEDVVSAISNLKLTPRMNVDLIFGTSGAPDFKPKITVFPFYLGRASEAEAAFKSILRIGPVSNGAIETPYTQWGAWSDGFCEKGERKPAYGVSTKKLPPTTWRAVYNEFKKFIATYGAAVGKSAILIEDYPIEKAVAIGSETSSFPFRSIPYHIVVIPWYKDKSFDRTAEVWGRKIRDLIRSTDGVAQDST